MIFFVLFVSAFLISLAITPIVIKLSKYMNVMAIPNERSVHKEPMPLLGGLSIFISFIVVYVVYELIINPATEYIFVGILLGCVIITIVGVVDDKFDLSPKKKLVGQFVATLPLLASGLSLKMMYIPFLDIQIQFGILSIPLTILWIIGISNAINLIDGLDGLCGGVMAISSLAYFVVSLSLGNVLLSAISIILFGSLLGFMKYNFFPAKIFMGDTGSLFLGFLMASLSLLELKQIAVTSFVIPFLILGIPITDTFYALVRRKLQHQPLSRGDKFHLHHCLIDLGLSQRQTVLVIYGISGLFSFFAVISSQFALEFSFIFLIVYMIAIQVLAQKIGMIRPKGTKNVKDASGE